jgi:CrcB protein
LQTLALARDGEGGRAFGYVALSVGLSLAAAAAGFALVDLMK